MIENREAKQVIVIRRDLKMRRGKEIAQASHAAVGWILEAMNQLFEHVHKAEDRNRCPPKVLTQAQETWLRDGTTKICVKVDSEEELLSLHALALARGLPVCLIKDEGRTEFHGVATYTALAVGPDWADRIDPITGTLPLY